MILFIVFLPLLAAAIAGLGNKQLGNVPTKVVTTGALFVASCALSWPIFFGFLAGTQHRDRDAGVRTGSQRRHAPSPGGCASTR